MAKSRAAIIRERVMGEWSDYFEDFPEENPVNYVNGRYVGPEVAEAIRATREAKWESARADQAKLDAEINRMIAAGNERASRKAK